MQGLNRQIRRMCEYFGYEVTKLERTRIMNVSLSGIPLGEWRDLTDDELIDLFKLIERSSSEAKPKAKAKPKTTGIKRPVVAIEKAMRKHARHQAVSALPRRDERKRTLTSAARRRIRRPGE